MLGRISGVPADCSTVRVESSVGLAFWADSAARSGRFGAISSAVRPSKIVLPLRRGANFSFFVPSRSFDPFDPFPDPILGPSWAVLGPVLGLLGLFLAVLGGRTWRAEGPEEAGKDLLKLSWACCGSLGPFGALFEASGAPFRRLWGCFRA